jgi:N-hydroxyarylamine O-acetyltransferase
VSHWRERSNPDELPRDLVDRVLAGLGLAAPPAADLAGLTTLYAAWCRHVSFDNVRKLIHLRSRSPEALPGDSPDEFFEAWLRFRTGGTCWAGNGALFALLSALGFDVRRGVGTMLARPNAPPNHGTVIAVLDGRRYLVDASILHSEPLLLDESRVTRIDHPAWGVECALRDGRFHVRWRSMHLPTGLDCRIDHLSVTREEFRERHELTREWSPFNFELTARLIRGDSVVGIALGKRVELTASGEVTERRLAGDERTRVLIEELGVSPAIVAQLPPDTPTPAPPPEYRAQPGGTGVTE